MDAISTKMNSMASKTDVENMKDDILTKTKEYIDESIQPVKDEVKALQTTVEHLQKTLIVGTSEKDVTIDALQKKIEKLDPAKKRVVFIGWAENVNADERIAVVSKYMKDNFSSTRYSDLGCYYKGPHNDRKLSNIAWVEFASIDGAKDFCKKVGESSIQLQNGGKQIMVKAARTDFQKERNWALKEAQTIIKTTPEGNGKNVEIGWKVPDTKSRHVTVDGITAFVQTPTENKGTFIAPFSTLVLPP